MILRFATYAWRVTIWQRSCDAAEAIRYTRAHAVALACPPSRSSVTLLRAPRVIRIEDGHVLLLDLPGLGLGVNEDAIQEYWVNA